MSIVIHNTKRLFTYPEPPEEFNYEIPLTFGDEHTERIELPKGSNYTKIEFIYDTNYGNYTKNISSMVNSTENIFLTDVMISHEENSSSCYSLYGKNMKLLRYKIEFSPANLLGCSITGI